MEAVGGGALRSNARVHTFDKLELDALKMDGWLSSLGMAQGLSG